MNMDIRKGVAIQTAIREAKERAEGKSFNIPLRAELFPATAEETIKEADTIENSLKALRANTNKTNLDIAEYNRLESRARALTRHLMTFGYKQATELPAEAEAEILKTLEAQGVTLTPEELKAYL